MENNKEVGNNIHYDYNIYIRNGQEMIFNPQYVSGSLNYFLLKRRNSAQLK